MVVRIAMLFVGGGGRDKRVFGLGWTEGGVRSRYEIIYGQRVPQCVLCVVYWGRCVVSNP